MKYLGLALAVCLCASVSAQETTPEQVSLPVNLSVGGGTSTTVLSITYDEKTAVAEYAHWTARVSRERLRQRGPASKRNGLRLYKGHTAEASTTGVAGGLAGSSTEPAEQLEVSLIFDYGRGRVRGIALRRSWLGPGLDHKFSGLLPLRVADAWIPRLAEISQAPGLIDPLTGGTPGDFSDGLPLPAPRHKALGALTVLVPGMFNLEPTREFVLRAAAHGRTVVIAYANPHPASLNSLRELTELDGEPLPAELVGRVLAHGSQERLVHSYLQSADRLLHVLEAMRRSPLVSEDPFSSRVSVIGHCQGSLAALLARKRLRAAGYPEAIGIVVGLAPPAAGLSQSESTAMRWAADMVSPLSPGLPGALRALHPRAVEARLGGEQMDLVLCGFSDENPDGDGLVTLDSAGSRAARFKAVKGASHASVFHDPRVIDLAIPALREPAATSD